MRAVNVGFIRKGMVIKESKTRDVYLQNSLRLSYSPKLIAMFTKAHRWPHILSQMNPVHILTPC
jgi:hypothetical protein